MRMKYKAKGFTLIELLVVISIIALLLSILMPSLKKAKGIAETVVCGTRLKNLGLGFMMYADSYGGYISPVNRLNNVVIARQNFPAWLKSMGINTKSAVTLSWRRMIMPELMANQGRDTNSEQEIMYYVRDKFSCPSFKPKKNESAWVSYAQNSDVDGEKFSKLRSPGSTVLMVDAQAVPDKQGVVYAHLWISPSRDLHADTPERIGKRHPRDKGFNALFGDLHVEKATDEYDLVWRRDGGKSVRH